MNSCFTKQYGNTKLEKIGYTGESNTLQVDLSTLSAGVYEFYTSTGEYCLLGCNDNDNTRCLTI